MVYLGAEMPLQSGHSTSWNVVIQIADMLALSSSITQDAAVTITSLWNAIKGSHCPDCRFDLLCSFIRSEPDQWDLASSRKLCQVEDPDRENPLTGYCVHGSVLDIESSHPKDSQGLYGLVLEATGVDADQLCYARGLEMRHKVFVVYLLHSGDNTGDTDIVRCHELHFLQD